MAEIIQLHYEEVMQLTCPCGSHVFNILLVDGEKLAVLCVECEKQSSFSSFLELDDGD